MLAGLEVRRRWRTVVALALLIGVVGALALAIAAGARRTGSSFGRFRDYSRSADVELAVIGEPTAEQLRELGREKTVAAVATLRAYGVAVSELRPLEAIGVPLDSSFGTVVDRGRLIAGRATDASVAGEVEIGESLATQLHLGVGDRLALESYTPDQIAKILGGASDAGALAGPRVELKIVGVVRRPFDLSDRALTGGFLALSPAFGRAYAGRIGVFGSYLRIRTAGGAADVPRTIKSARRIFKDSLLDARSLSVETEGARDAIHVLTLALWIAAGVGAVAGVVAIGIVLGRELSLMSEDHGILRALGFTRRQRAAIGAPFAAIVAGGGALVAVVGAIAASPLFPIGVARRAEPDIGVHVDASVLVLGAAGVVVIVLVVALVAMSRASARSALAREAHAPRRTSVVVDASARAGFAPTVTYGLRMALEVGKGRRAVPVRSAFAGSILGVLGVTAVVVFASSLSHLVATPRLYGWTWDFKVEDTTTNTPCGGTDFGVSKTEGIDALTEVCFENVQVDGHATAATAFRTVGGATIDPEVLEGRAPRGRHEVALGSATLHTLGKHIGDRVHVQGRMARVEYEIVGRVVLPPLGQAQPLADGATFTGEGFAPLYDQNLFSRYFVGRFAAGADVASVERRIATIPEFGTPAGPRVAVEVERVHEIDWLPESLAVLMGALALLAVVHALGNTVARRRRDLALLKALGFRRRQIRATMAWEATTLAVVGLVVGIPSGLVVGRLAWRLVADGLGVAPVVTTPWLAVLLTIPGAILLVNVTALLPARAAARTVPSVALRAE